MKELIKVVAKKLFILSIIFNTIYSLADYGEAYVLSYFGVFLFTMNTYYLVSREPLLVVRNVNGLFKETKKIFLYF